MMLPNGFVFQTGPSSVPGNVMVLFHPILTWTQRRFWSWLWGENDIKCGNKLCYDAKIIGGLRNLYIVRGIQMAIIQTQTRNRTPTSAT